MRQEKNEPYLMTDSQSLLTASLAKNENTLGYSKLQSQRSWTFSTLFIEQNTAWLVKK
jgi:hypothetical protein